MLINPFAYNTPRPEMLYGRQYDLNRIFRGLTTSPGNSYALIGGRRMGKTSLLEAIYQKLETVDPTKVEVPYIFPITLLFNLTGEDISSASALFQLIASDIRENLSIHLNTEIEEFVLQPDQPPAPAFERALPRWNSYIFRAFGRQLRLILLLDECENLVGKPWSGNLYGAFRHLLESRITRNMIKLVMAGSHNFITRVYQEGSPLRGILECHKLRVLDINATRQLIQEPIAYAFTELLVDAIIEKSGGHPFLVQFIMHHLWENGLQNTTIETINKLASDFHHTRNEFQDWLQDMGGTASLVYEKLIKVEKSYTEEEIRSSLVHLPSDFIQALDGLCYHGLVVQEDDGAYRNAGKMFMDWYLAHAPENNPEIVNKRLAADLGAKGGIIINAEHLEFVQDKHVGIDQRGQKIEGPQTNIGEDAQGSLLSGNFNSDVKINPEDNQQS